MENLVLTNSTNSIKVEFNDYAVQEGKSHALLNKRITSLIKTVAGPIAVFIFGGPSFLISATASNGVLEIDTIDGVAMTTDQEIYDALVLLMA